MSILPLSDGGAELRVRDLCLPGVVEARVKVVAVYKVELSVIDKVQEGSTFKAKVSCKILLQKQCV